MLDARAEKDLQEVKNYLCGPTMRAGGDTERQRSGATFSGRRRRLRNALRAAK